MTDFTTRPAAVLNAEGNLQSRIVPFAETGRRIQTTPLQGGTSTGRVLLPWSEQRTGQLMLLWAKGRTGSEIAAELSGTTRNAVIGKVHRLHLPSRGRTPGSGRPKSETPPKPRPSRAKFPTLTFKPHKRPTPPPIDDRNIPISQRRSFLELEREHCRYPVGEPDTPAFFFCGGPVAEDSYCAGHWARCHMEVPRRVR